MTAIDPEKVETPPMVEVSDLECPCGFVEERKVFDKKERSI